MGGKGLLEGKIIIVTGSGSGIGRAACLLFVQEGAKVAALDNNADALEETVRMAHSQGNILGQTADVGSKPDVDRAIAICVERFGPLSGAFNNAGIDGRTASPDRLGNYPMALWQRLIEVNQTGVLYCMQAEISAMLRAGGGAIVNTASVAGVRGMPSSGAYAATKHAVIGLSKTAAIEYARDGLRVNVVAPGAVDTPMNASIDMRSEEHTSELQSPA